MSKRVPPKATIFPNSLSKKEAENNPPQANLNEGPEDKQDYYVEATTPSGRGAIELYDTTLKEAERMYEMACRRLKKSVDLQNTLGRMRITVRLKAGNFGDIAGRSIDKNILRTFSTAAPDAKAASDSSPAQDADAATSAVAAEEGSEEREDYHCKLILPDNDLIFEEAPATFEESGFDFLLLCLLAREFAQTDPTGGVRVTLHLIKGKHDPLNPTCCEENIVRTFVAIDSVIENMGFPIT